MSGITNSISLASDDKTVYESLGLKDKEIYTGNEKETREVTKDIDKDAFLKLMMTKLQNQDPLNPTDDTEFLSQLAQFTTLEQITNLNSTTELSQGFSMVGKYVSVKIGQEKVIAMIDSVISNSGNVQFNIGGYLFDIDDILEVYDPSVLTINSGNSQEPEDDSETE